MSASSATDQEPRRLTPTERLHEVTMAAMQRPHAEPTTSVKLNRSVTNGQWGIEIDVTKRDHEEAFAVAVELARRAESEFPYIKADKPAPKEDGEQQRKVIAAAKSKAKS